MITPAMVLYFFVPLSYLLASIIAYFCKSKLSRWVILIGCAYFAMAHALILFAIFDECEGHSFIDYVRCNSISDQSAKHISDFTAIAIRAYLFASGPIFIAALAWEYKVRRISTCLLYTSPSPRDS